MARAKAAESILVKTVWNIHALMQDTNYLNLFFINTSVKDKMLTHLVFPISSTYVITLTPFTRHF